MDVSGYSGLFLVRRFLDDGVLEVTNMSDIDKAVPHGCDNGALTDRFGVLIQGLLAIVAFSTLMCEYQNRTLIGLFAFTSRRKWRRSALRKLQSPRGVLLTFGSFIGLAPNSARKLANLIVICFLPSMRTNFGLD